jgi:subtilase family serine protease
MALNGGSARYRNFPDVAMVARDIFIVMTAVPTNGPPVPGQQESWVGTSASSPLWAGFAALLNQQAAAQGSPPVGFLNPALYEIGQTASLYTNCFHDITSGNNTWYNTNTHTGSPNLYYATNGYDLCTGWGSPAGAGLVNALVSLSGPVFVNFHYTGSLASHPGTILYPWKTLAQGTNAVRPGGTIIIITGGSSSETMTISKRMTITAQDGAVTIGH